jgi:hypothetical protein
MVFPERLRAAGPRRAYLGAAIAGLGTWVYCGIGWWSLARGEPLPSIGVLLLVLVGVGATAGLISGRLSDAPASWVAAVVALILAQLASYAVFPNWPTSEDGFWGSVLLGAFFLLPFIAGGHLFGATISNRVLRRPERRG